MRIGCTEELYATNSLDAVVAVQYASLVNYNRNRCAKCGAEGQMLTAETAATICQCSRRVIYRWIEEGSLHFVELADRSVMVCGRSLNEKMEDLESSTASLSASNDQFQTRC